MFLKTRCINVFVYIWCFLKFKITCSLFLGYHKNGYGGRGGGQRGRGNGGGRGRGGHQQGGPMKVSPQ